MSAAKTIPAFGLFGETGSFPDVFHAEAFSARAPIHGWQIAPHRHGGMAQLFLVESGHIEAQVDDRSFQVGARSFLFVPAHRVHALTFEPETEGQVMSFPLVILGRLADSGADVQGALAQPISGAVSGALAGLAQILTQAAASTGPFRTEQVVGLAQAMLAGVAEVGQRPTPRPRAQAQARAQAQVQAQVQAQTRVRLERLDALIAERRSEGWTPARYAQELAISTGHLSRLCRAETGLGAAAYIEARVMEEASRLLAFTQVPVAEVGYRLGFPDPSYFSKRFRKVLGDTPSAYRARFAA